MRRRHPGRQRLRFLLHIDETRQYGTVHRIGRYLVLKNLDIAPHYPIVALSHLRIQLKLSNLAMTQVESPTLQQNMGVDQCRSKDGIPFFCTNL
jgi:hypothetical protein